MNFIAKQRSMARELDELRERVVALEREALIPGSPGAFPAGTAGTAGTPAEPIKKKRGRPPKVAPMNPHQPGAQMK